MRVNRAAVLLRELSPADAVRALQAEFELSERQARRYVNVARPLPRALSAAGQPATGRDQHPRLPWPSGQGG